MCPCHWSVTKSCLTLWDPMDYRMPGLPVPHYILEFAQVQVHWISDAIQPSHSLPPSSPSAFILSQYRGPFQWVSSSHQVAKVLEGQLQHISMNVSGWFPLGFTGDLLAAQGTLKSLLQDHNSKASILQYSAFFYGPAITTIHDYWRNHSFDSMDIFQQSSDVFAF